MFFNKKIKDVKDKIKNSVSRYIYNDRVIPKINYVNFAKPATIIFWEDGSKTVVKAYEKFDPEKGLAIAIAKKAMGNKGNYNNEINEWVNTYKEDFNSNRLTNLNQEEREAIYQSIKRKADLLSNYSNYEEG